MPHVEPPRPNPTPAWLRLLFVFGLLFLFLVAVKLMENSVKLVGADTADRLFQGVSNPFAGLAVGILATVLVQSSSVTTSIIVGLVGSGRLDVHTAVPMVMGANIGTSITNTVVSIGHITRGAEFRRAFAGATMHDFFNLLTVAILLPIEVATGFLRRSAEACSGLFRFGGVAYESPVKKVIKTLAGGIEHGITDLLHLSGWWAVAAMVVAALVLIVAALTFVTRIMRGLMANRMESALNRILGKSGLLGMLVGVVLTVAVQSSSITTSLLVPLIGAGIISLEVAFPLTLGANVGTTVTALLAVMAAEKTGAAMTIALTHLLFNLTGILILYPIPAVRRIPLQLARGLASLAMRNRVYIVVYILTVFVGIPLLGILLFQ
jgi:sodium-dependent phosphate cotransporter